MNMISDFVIPVQSGYQSTIVLNCTLQIRWRKKRAKRPCLVVSDDFSILPTLLLPNHQQTSAHFRSGHLPASTKANKPEAARNTLVFGDTELERQIYTETEVN